MSDFEDDVTSESILAPLRVEFDRRLKLQFHGAKFSWMAKKIRDILLTGVISLFATGFAAAGEKFSAERFVITPWAEGWSAGVHWGRAIKNSVRTLGAFNQFIIEYRDYNLISLGVRKKILNYDKYFSLYSEFNVSRIFGKEDYGEIFFTPTISWDYFPWDKYVDTSASVGAGFSYTSIRSDFDNSGEKLMASMIFELEFTRPEYERWSLFMRIHHRSTASIFANGGGSNFHAIGLRYHFN